MEISSFLHGLPPAPPPPPPYSCSSLWAPCRREGGSQPLPPPCLSPKRSPLPSVQLQQFVSAVQAGGVDLEEPDEVEVEYTPGIDYDDAAAVADLTRRQNMVDDLCPLTRLALSMRKPKRGRRPVSDTIAEWRFRKREDPPGGATEPATDS